MHRSRAHCQPFCLSLSDNAEQVFQRFNIISFGVRLPDTVENSIFDVTGARRWTGVATETWGKGWGLVTGQLSECGTY